MEDLVAKMPAGGSRLRLGTVTTVEGQRMVNVDGNILRATWADPIVVDDGDPVEVQLYSAGVGQSRVHVSGRSTGQPRPRTGIVTQVPAGSPTITVEASGGSYSAEPVGGPYATGDKVHLDWGAGSPRAIGKVTLTSTPPPRPQPLPAPPPPPSTGKTSASARSSNTYWGPGGWGSWGGGGKKVHQGDYGSGPLTGAWFYGTPFRILDGRKITRIRFRTGQRLAVGSHNASATFHFYAHSSQRQPGGNINRVTAAHNVTIKPGQGPIWIDLPLSFAATLVAGGGIAITGNPYTGMAGVTSSAPDSGALILYWTK